MYIMLLKCNHIELAKSKEEMKAYSMYYQSYFSKHTACVLGNFKITKFP